MQDELNVIQAERRCKEKFPNSPCLISFEKTAELTYRAICGAKRDIKINLGEEK